MLRRKGFDVRTVSNGLQGHASYFRDPADLVGTDIQMADLNGVEMMRYIRTVNPNVHAVYMNVESNWFLARDRER
jgi:DNA-binding NtrC family response regulator